MPALVRLFGGEAAVGAAGPLAGLGGDQAVVMQDASDGGGGRHRQAGLGQVLLQGQRPGVQAVGD